MRPRRRAEDVVPVLHAAAREVDDEHLARPDAALAHDVRLAEVEHARFRCQREEIGACDGIPRRT